MAIFGIGIDLVEVGRIKQSMMKFDERFKNRIFSKEEQSFCELQKEKFLSYAAHFASKEAFSKALGTGLRGKISWQEIVVVDNGKSRPELKIYGRAKELLDNRKTFLSITHTDNYASAIVIVEE
jgi:holo-[acyl-carrier protein] synthase